MAQLKLKFLSQNKYNSLSDDEKNDKETLFMVKGEETCAIYNRETKYASSSDIRVLETVADLPSIGEVGFIYVTRQGELFIWDDASLKYVDASSGSYDIIDGGNANTKMDITT